MMNRRSFLKGCFAVGAACSLAGCSGEFYSKNNPKKPNIVVFLVDDMGLMDTSVPMLADENGNPQCHPLNDWYRTPNMERLAEQGVRFSNFYAHTVCSPTRVSIMTGQNSARHRTTNWINLHVNNGGKNGPPKWNWEGITKEDVTLPRLLQKEGYRTIHIGKAHFGPLDYEGEEPLNLGFDANIAGSAIGHPGSYYGKANYGANTDRPVPHLKDYWGTDTFLTEALTLEAKKRIDTAIAAKRPFFLHMSHYAVHAPFHSDPRFAANYANSGKGARAQAFATLIEGMDKSLGDLMDHLEAKGVADNTLIFFLGDNGSDAPLGGYNDIGSSAPLRGRKGSKWEGGIRVPFIAAWAKSNPKNKWQKKMPIAAGRLRSEVGACYDLFPTIADLVNAPVPADYPVDGQILTKLLVGQSDPEHRDEFLSHYPHPRKKENNYFSSYRRGKWKVRYEYLNDSSRYGLFDVENDPSESTNLASENPEKLKAMMQAMVQELQSQNAQYPVDGQGKEVKPVIP